MIHVFTNVTISKKESGMIIGCGAVRLAIKNAARRDVLCTVSLRIFDRISGKAFAFIC